MNHEEAEVLVEQLADLNYHISQMQERANDIKAKLKELGEGNFDFSAYKLKVQKNRRINQKRAVDTYGDKVCSLKWDADVAKKVLTGDQYEELYDEFDPKISVVPVD